MIVTGSGKIQMFNKLKKLRSDTCGGTLAVFAVALPVILGAFAVSVEAGYWMKSKSDVQMIADMAAFAGAKELETNTVAKTKIVTKLDAMNNGFDFETGRITVNSPPSTGDYAGYDAVEVIIVQQGLKFFSGIVDDRNIQYEVRAVAATLANTEACALALSTTANNSIYATGSAIVDLEGCSIGSNSQSASAIKFHGSADVDSDCIYSAGGIEGEERADLNCTAGKTDAPQIDDPFSDLEAPDLSVAPWVDCQTPDHVSGFNYELEAGRYCNNMDIKGEYSLDPGTYVFDGIEVKFTGGSASLVGTGVTIILMNGATFKNLNGGSEINITAPTAEGPYKGVAIFGDPDTQTAGTTISFNGSANSVIQGLVYFPNQNLEFGGNTGSDTTNCTLLIANTIELSGNSELEMSGCESSFGLVSPSIVGTFIVE